MAADARCVLRGLHGCCAAAPLPPTGGCNSKALMVLRESCELCAELRPLTLFVSERSSAGGCAAARACAGIAIQPLLFRSPPSTLKAHVQLPPPPALAARAAAPRHASPLGSSARWTPSRCLTWAARTLGEGPPCRHLPGGRASMHEARAGPPPSPPVLAFMHRTSSCTHACAHQGRLLLLLPQRGGAAPRRAQRGARAAGRRRRAPRRRRCQRALALGPCTCPSTSSTSSTSCGWRHPVPRAPGARAGLGCAGGAAARRVLRSPAVGGGPGGRRAGG